MQRHPYPLIGFFGSVAIVMSLVLGLAACKDNQVGRQCFIPNPEGDGGVAQTVVGSPAIECESSICLHFEGTSNNLCTARCSSDSDCETAPESPCKTGFTCGIPVVTGNFCCEKLCVCRDFLGGETGTLPMPAACDPANQANECCNLEGRSGNPSYPLCK